MSLVATNDPAALVREAYAAFDRGDGAALAALVDTEVLQEYRDVWVGGIVLWAELTDDGRHRPDGSGGTTGGSFGDPELIQAHAAMPVQRVPGVSNLGELAALTPRELLIRIVAEWRRTIGYEVPPTILDVILERPDLALVMYRRSDDPAEPPHMVRAVLRDGRWWLLAWLAPGPAWGFADV